MAGAPVQQGADLLPLLRTLENSGDNAQNPRSGAIGRYQIMPGVGRSYGVEPKDLYDPAKNEQVATSLVNDLWKRYNGNIQDVLVAWDAGTRRADRWVASGRQGFLPRETQSYLSRAAPYLNIGDKPMPNVGHSEPPEPADVQGGGSPPEET